MKDGQGDDFKAKSNRGTKHQKWRNKVCKKEVTFVYLFNYANTVLLADPSDYARQYGERLRYGKQIYGSNYNRILVGVFLEIKFHAVMCYRKMSIHLA
jgi:hypothetical protein